MRNEQWCRFGNWGVVRAKGLWSELSDGAFGLSGRAGLWTYELWAVGTGSEWEVAGSQRDTGCVWVEAGRLASRLGCRHCEPRGGEAIQRHGCLAMTATERRLARYPCDKALRGGVRVVRAGGLVERDNKAGWLRQYYLL
jgi:hypothetical protein